MKIVYNNIIPFQGFMAINLFGVLFARTEYKGKLNKVDINHEAIHSAQQKELLYIGFYLLYLLNWILTGFRYYYISFEREAYDNEQNLEYLNSRKSYSWIKLIF